MNFHFHSHLVLFLSPSLHTLSLFLSKHYTCTFCCLHILPPLPHPYYQSTFPFFQSTSLKLYLTVHTYTSTFAPLILPSLSLHPSYVLQSISQSISCPGQPYVLTMQSVQSMASRRTISCFLKTLGI